MQQPSAQGIASLYRGNPQPLQQAIQREQQAKPGLPPDLQKMLALQIVTNEEDGFAAQKAMEQLRQMGGQQGGKPPTVMASLEQQAKQKLEAQAQAARQQAAMRGLPAGLFGVQGEPPQPEAQPNAQGIDQLPTEFDMAEGGIVAFSGEDRSDVPEDDAATKDSEGIKKALKFVAGLPIEALKTLVSAPGYGLSKDDKADSAQRPRSAPAVTRPTEKMTPQQMEQKAAPPTGIAALAGNRPAPRPAPVVSEAPPAPEVTPVVDSDALKMVRDRMNESPEARETAAIAKYKAAIGEPDTAQHDRLIAELERRKQELAPKKGFEGLMEYLGEISRADSRGRGSFAAGAAGAARLNDLNKDRALQQFELSKQAIEVSQKKLDTVRSYAKDVYGIGKTTFDQVYKDQYDAAKEVVKDDQEARKLAQQNTLKRLELEQQAILRREEMRSNEKVAGMRADGRTDLTPNQRAEIANKALDNINATLKANIKLQMEVGKNPALMQQLLKAETDRLMAAAGGTTMGAAPGVPQGPGGTTRMRFDAQGNPIK